MEKRRFTPQEKREALENQDYLCGGGCGTDLWHESIGKGQGHHIVPWSLGGDTSMENLIVLCTKCHLYHDTLAMCGVIYGGYDISEADESQIRDTSKFEKGTFLTSKNRRNPDIRKTLFKYRNLSGSEVSDKRPFVATQLETF
jgi:hypothetical protein